jgi:2,3-bisphosphoglycerate-independent phosphoglycerate mutase
VKYIVILGDGMADYPLAELGNKTPLQAAHKPNMDFLAGRGEVGLVKTIPDGMNPGSDTANLSVMGYDPRKYYSGRSPLEAASIGIQLSDKDVTYRCNLVTLSDEEKYEDKIMVDYSSDEISTAEADELIQYLSGHFKKLGIELYTGVSYRHCLVLREAETGTNLTPPHDISDKCVHGHLPKDGNAELLFRMMKESYELLKDHPVNQKRIQNGKRPANSVWFWGEGRKPALSPFYEKYHKKGAVISAVDLIKGIALCAGMESIDVEGVTGNIDTNFEGKAAAALDALANGADFVYIHIEAPDECGHRREIGNKVRSIELIDEKIAGPIVKEMNNRQDDFSIMILPDHPTPLSLRTHTAEPVPYLIYRSSRETGSGAKYDEESAKNSGLFVAEGHLLLDNFFEMKEIKDV